MDVPQKTGFKDRIEAVAPTKEGYKRIAGYKANAKTATDSPKKSKNIMLFYRAAAYIYIAPNIKPIGQQCIFIGTIYTNTFACTNSVICQYIAIICNKYSC